MDERTRKIIESEKDPRILQALLSQALEFIAQQKLLVAKLQEEQALSLQSKFNLDERIKLLRRSIFGKSTEKRAEATDRPRDKSQTEAMLFSQAAFPAEVSREEQKKNKWSGLPSCEVAHHLSDDELNEEAKLRGIDNPHPSMWKNTGLYDESFQIQIIERSYVKEIHKKYKYKLDPKFIPDSDKEVIITANGPSGLLPGMNYSTDFVISVVADKYISHMPLERQTREMESLGLKGIQNSTLSRLSGLAAASLEPVQAEILKELKSSDLALHLDETPWKIQDKTEKDGYMWVVSNRYGSHYCFKPTRSGQVVKDFLSGYSGPVVTDGYVGYNILAKLEIPQAFCWAHARREFIKIEDHDPTVKPILDDIDRLFEIEREASSFEDLLRLRKEKSQLITEGLHKNLIGEYSNSRPGSQKRKAIEYLTERWAGFMLFLNDNRIPLSNNEAERTIRHAVVGRKNYYGSGNHAGADTAATLFTVIESCKKNDLDPRSYLSMALHLVAAGKAPPTPLAHARALRQ
nr:hypothetical protein HAGR004_01730 [Bdellovibrio sp. HAGR004]BFD65310.1 hypothetical protein HAGR004_03320 [Bdellovibrio sp. HAGR004]BFD65899.1 hypothetical protein HAGR004_09210 [Bdellovibrio sp. HAGR004]BFD66580.1 hypothetical protein HAGR004_16020 [Bdellovibrio sp. HAGR004]BFD67013.1 hypothetical protein HAGR004_20350 [Bdellovibrio sp. HAGR004]